MNEFNIMMLKLWLGSPEIMNCWFLSNKVGKWNLRVANSVTIMCKLVKFMLLLDSILHENLLFQHNIERKRWNQSLHMCNILVVSYIWIFQHLILYLVINCFKHFWVDEMFDLATLFNEVFKIIGVYIFIWWVDWNISFAIILIHFLYFIQKS